MVIAIANFKGGVGKTTTARELAAGIARRGYRVLLVDLDAQANLTFAAGLLRELDTTVYDLLLAQAQGERMDAREALFRLRGEAQVSLLPASLRMARADLELGGATRRETLLSRALSDLLTGYEFCIIDCPPSMGLLTLNALALADTVIIPTTADYLPIKGIEVFTGAVNRFVINQGLNDDLTIGGVLFTRHNPRTVIAQELVEMLERGPLGPSLLGSVIRQNVALVEAQAQGMSVFESAPESNGAADYAALSDELLNRWHG